MEETFNNDTFYMYLGDSITTKYIHDNVIDEITINPKDIVKGDILNKTNIFGCLVTFAPIPKIDDDNFRTPKDVLWNKYNQGILTCSIQQCCMYLPYMGDMNGTYYHSAIHLITQQNSDGYWTAKINDWYGDRSQATEVEYYGKDLELLLQGLVLYCAYHNIISPKRFKMCIEHFYGIEKRKE